VPSDAGCKTDSRLVKFEPGIYTDATALNNLFGDADCKNATFWFAPDDHGTSDLSDDTTGVYYFDFRNTTDAPYACGRDLDFWGIIGTLGSDDNHEWCIGGKAADYSGQRVIGGTPYNWDPAANPVSNQVTLTSDHAGDGVGFWSWLQTSQFSPKNNDVGAKIDGNTSNLAMTGNRPGGSIWVSNFTQVPRGAYGEGIQLEVAQSGTNVDRMNSPTVQVNWGSLFNGGTCGPYTLAKPPADGSIAIATLSTADATNLNGCLNTGDRINTAVVQYNVSRPWFNGAPYPTAKLDGARFVLTTHSQPTFPRPPSPTDPGGDCDSTQAGVQFIFGGDSHVYVPNGGMEVCAGPNAQDKGNGKEIAVFGVPSVPRLVPSSVNGTTGSVTSANDALRIAEGSGLAAANISKGGTETLRFPGYSVPSGYSVTSVALRASYNPGGTQPSFQIKTTGGSTICNTTNVGNSGGIQANTYDVTSCLKSSLGSAFNVQWNAGSGSGSGPQLDGVEFVVTISPTDPNANLRPQSGCINASPNLWYGVSSPDCALLRVDAPFWSELSSRRGRLSIKGTVYAPSAAIDVDDTDVVYPLVSRGLVVRHLRIRGFKYRSGYAEPAFSNYLDKTTSAREVVFYACAKDSGTCTQSDGSLQGRAAVTFEAVTNKPTVKNWSASEN
jgi:hypothetical protein